MQAVFLRVVNLSVTAGYVITAIMVMRLILRRAPRWAVCALWALAAVRLTCPFSPESALSLLPSGAVVNETAILTRDVGAPIIRTGFELIDARANEALSGMTAPTGESAAASVSKLGDPSPTKNTPIVTAVDALSWVWLVGMGLMLLYGAGSYVLLRRRLRTAVHWRDELWQSEEVEAPFVLGVFRPRIYLPFAIESPAFAHIIAHERAHIRRHDQATKLFAWVLLSAYWFNPLCWIAYGLLGRDIELACDELVTRDLDADERKRYARALLAWGVNRPTLDACPVAFGEVGLKERILKVINYKKPALWALALAMVLIAVSAVCLLTSPTAAAEVSPTESPAMDIVPPTAQPNITVNQTYASPSKVPDTVPVLTVRPCAVTAEAAKTIVTAIFGDAPIYEDTGRSKEDLAEAIDYWEGELSRAETDENSEYAVDITQRLEYLRRQLEIAPEAVDPVLCDWTFRPTDDYTAQPEPDSSVTDDMSIRARAELDGLNYIIEARNYDAPDADSGGVRLHGISITMTEDTDSLPLTFAAPTQNELDAMYKKVDGWLDRMGLENWTVVAAENIGGNLTVITAQPLYEGVPQLPLDVGLVNGQRLPDVEDQTLLFTFLGSGTLLTVRYATPLEVLSSQPSDALMSLHDALTAAELEIGLEDYRWQFGYTRTPAGGDTGDMLLIPSYRCGSYSLPGAFPGVLIISAADGTLLADTRPSEEAAPEA